MSCFSNHLEAELSIGTECLEGACAFHPGIHLFISALNLLFPEMLLGLSLYIVKRLSLRDFLKLKNWSAFMHALLRVLTGAPRQWHAFKAAFSLPPNLTLFGRLSVLLHHRCPLPRTYCVKTVGPGPPTCGTDLRRVAEDVPSAEAAPV